MAAAADAEFTREPHTTGEAIEMIEAARTPADLFGRDAARIYRRLARLTHPDARAGDVRAAAAFAKVADLWQRRSRVSGPIVARGDLANLYLVSGGLLKLPRNPADNDLMDREAGGLRTLARFVSLAEIRHWQPGGVDPRDAAWMWRRLLVALGAAHHVGLSHGAVIPEHVLIHPADHGLVLVDWCYSGRPGVPLPAIVGRYRDWYPPEVTSRRTSGPATDIWLATECIAALIRGRMPKPLGAFARGCQIASPARRPHDAWQLLAELDDLLERLYGPRKFRPFAIPA